MTPEEIELLAKTIENASEQDNSLTYVVLSGVALFAPIMALIQRFSIKKAVSKVIEDSVKPQIKIIEKMNKATEKSTEQMFAVMEMHIDELRHMKFEHEDIKKKVSSNTNEINKLKR